MAKSKPSETQAEPTGVSSQQLLGQFLKDHKDEHFAFIQPKHVRISTGSLLLDSLVSVRSGGVVRLVGKGAELGKTSEAFVLADNYMKTMPKAKTIYFKAEARLTPEIIARSGLKFVFTAEEWVEGTVFVFPVNIFEIFAGNLELIVPAMYEAGEHICVILDSMDGLMLRADREKDLWKEKADNVKVAGVPKLTKELFRRLGLMITHYDVLMLMTGQYSASIQLDQYADKTPRQAESSGGNAVAHQSDYVFEYQARWPGDQILEDPNEKPDAQKNKSLGVYATLMIKKSATDVSGTKIKIPIRKGRKGCAIWVEREIGDMMLGWGQLEKAGSWLKMSPELIKEVAADTSITLPEKIQGINKLYALLEEHPGVTEFLRQKFLKLISIEQSE